MLKFSVFGAIFLLLTGIEIVAQSTHLRRTSIGHGKKKYLFSFVVMSDTHLGEGVAGHDYGTKGYFDQLTGHENGYPEQRLADAIKWINLHYKKEDIRFVMISGDLTNSAETSEFLKMRQMMDTLHVPYVPLIGNHDVWPYIHSGDEATYACGDSMMNEIFATVFDTLRKKFNFDNGTRLTKWFDPESNSYAYLQNFSLTLMGQKFIFLDFNPRYHVGKGPPSPKVAPGIGPDAQLTDYPGGTMDYLRKTLKTAADNKESIFLVSHHPPANLPFGWSARAAFDPAEKAVLAKTFRPYKHAMRGWFAGHMHRWREYRFFKAGGLRIYETKANKGAKHGCLRLVKVYAP